MARGLSNGPSDEYDVRNAEDGLSAEKVAQHAGDQAPEQRTERRRGRDEFLRRHSAASSGQSLCGPHLLTCRQLGRSEIASDGHESPRDHTGVVA